MRNKIQQAFDPIQATPTLKNDTKAYLSRKLYQSAKRAAPMRRFAVAFACFAVLLLGGGYYAYFTPISAISIDVNPSIELQINRFDRVVLVEGYNEDGEALVPLLSVRHLSYPQAVESILEQEQIKRYLAEGELLSMTVAGNSERKRAQMLTALSPYSTRENISCHAANTQEIASAHAHGLSVGKYSAYLMLSELDPSVTVEEVKHLTMRQIRDQIRALSGEERLPLGSENGNGAGWQGGNHNGNGGHNGGHGGNGGNGYRGGRN